MPTRNVTSRARSRATASALWSVARDFAAPWHPAIAGMREERDAAGSLIRVFSARDDPATYRERLTWFSDSDRCYRYRCLEGIAGVERYAGALCITDTEDGAEITMSAEITATEPRLEEIAAGTQAIFDQGVSALATVAAGRAEPPRRPAPVGVKARFIDGDPRLAINVTPPRDGPLCLFLHGIGGARGNWDAQLAMAGANLRAAALDLRGYGDSAPGEGQSTIADYCDDILRVRAALGAERLVLCGLSYGAWIATSFAMRHPDMLAGLVLAGGCTGMSEAGPEEREAFRTSRQVPLDAGRTPADFAPQVVDILAGPEASDAARDALLASMSAIPAATYRDALNCFTRPPERFDFSRLSMPVLMMTGAHDRLAPPEEIRQVAARIHAAAEHADIRFEVIEGAGHVCNLEAPERFNDLLGAFLRKFAP